ncbi:MAG TPA: phage holin family protein [Longimicrobiales bacterium]|nr:phage holin family protein [Longimicrobiales bacterium]
MRFLIRLLVTAAALWVAIHLVPGIRYDGGWLGMLGVALVFGIVNALVRPVIFLLTCPLVILSLGLFIFVLNALMLSLTAALSNGLGLGFHVAGFGSALLGSIVVSLTSMVLSLFVGDNAKKERRRED